MILAIPYLLYFKRPISFTIIILYCSICFTIQTNSHLVYPPAAKRDRIFTFEQNLYITVLPGPQKIHSRRVKINTIQYNCRCSSCININTFTCRCTGILIDTDHFVIPNGHISLRQIRFSCRCYRSGFGFSGGQDSARQQQHHA